MAKYRIKSEQEFIEEFGTFWKKKVHWNSGNLMDYLFDTKLDNYTDKHFNSNFDFIIIRIDDDGYNWYITSKMVKQILPNYNENKTLVYD